MDLLDIIIIAAASVGVIAFVVLAVVIVRQGRALTRLEDRIGPPVPMAAAPSLERVRAITSQPDVRVDVPDTALPPIGDADGQAAQVAPAAASDAALRAAQRRGGSGDSGSGGGNGALIALVGVVALAAIAVLVWFVFLRGDGGTATPATAGTTGTTSIASTSGASATTATTPATAAEVPEEVPPVANKAAYTVAVLNASGRSGAAANRVAPKVQAAGYTLGVVDNASQQNLAASEVQYVPGRKEVAWNLAKDLGVTMAGPINALSDGRIGTADVVVIVGQDLAK